MQQYLENRINNAFKAGQKSGKKITVLNGIAKLLDLCTDIRPTTNAT